jgi:hypothetical protein
MIYFIWNVEASNVLTRPSLIVIKIHSNKLSVVSHACMSIFKHIFAKTRLFFQNTRPSLMSKRTRVISARRVYFSNARVWILQAWMWFWHVWGWLLHEECDFNTHECYHYTHKCDLDQQTCYCITLRVILKLTN